MKRIEWIKGKLKTLFPEWVQIIIFVLIGLLLVVILFRPSVYIISRAEIINFEGQKIFLLDYARNGITQSQAMFYSGSDRERYERYLERTSYVENKR
jgi:hypothetical protein